MDCRAGTPPAARGNRGGCLTTATGKVQKILNRRINSWRASIACWGFILLSIFSLRSLFISSIYHKNYLINLYFTYLAETIPRESRNERIQTVMSVVVTRSIRIET